MKRSVFIYTILVFSLCGLSVVFAGSGGRRTAIDFMAVMYSEATPVFWEAVIGAFEEEHPDIRVDLDMVPKNEIYLQTTKRIADRREPDILNTDGILVQYAAEGLLEPLEGYMDAGFRDRFLPSLLASGMYGGSLQALPFLASVNVLVYNEDILEEAGVKPPANAEDFVQVAMAVTDPPDLYGFGMPVTILDGYESITPLLWAAGGSWIDGNGKCVLNSTGGIEALTFASDLVRKRGVVYPRWDTETGEQTREAMIEGRVAMLIADHFFMKKAEAGNPGLRLGSVPIPAGRKRYSPASVYSLMVFKSSAHKQEAFEFISFCYRDEWYARACLNEHYLPVTGSVSNLLREDPELGTFIKMLPGARFYPLHSMWTPMVIEAVGAWRSVISGQKEPKPALDEAVRRINTELIR